MVREPWDLGVDQTLEGRDLGVDLTLEVTDDGSGDEGDRLVMSGQNSARAVLPATVTQCTPTVM